MPGFTERNWWPSMDNKFADGPWFLSKGSDYHTILNKDGVPIAVVNSTESKYNISDIHTASLISWAPVLFVGYKSFISILSRLPNFDIKHSEKVSIDDILLTANEVLNYIKEAR